MRIVFVNLNTNGFYFKTTAAMLYGTSVATKHRFFLDYLLKESDVEVCNFVNNRGFSLYSKPLPNILSKFVNLFNKLDHLFVMKENHVVGSIKFIKSVGDIKKDDVVISYIHYPSSLSELENVNGLRAVCVMHSYGTDNEANELRKINPIVLFNEFDVTKHSKIFKKNCSWFNGDFFSFPFVFNERFKKLKSFKERENKAFSPGTIATYDFKEFVEVYGTNCLQVSRKQILDNRDKIEQYVACYNSERLEGYKPIKVPSYLPSFIKTIAHVYDMFHMGKQKKYFSFDMVERFNNFKMFICGEETTGSPAIGFVEGMACGSAFIGNCKIGCYEDYGMVEGIHYIGYDGSLKDLIRKIEYYQQEEHQEELEKIANAGHCFALENFNKDVVASRILDSLRKELKIHCNK